MSFLTKPNIHVSFNQLDEIYSEEKSSYIDLLNKISSEYLNYINDIKQILDSGEEQAYRKLRHKISSSLGLLEITELNDYLLIIKENFTEALAEKDSIKKNTEECFTEIQTALKNKISEFK
jgi:HPt (histidine-containing phosphotransfer) domain-containing protein